MVVALTTRMPSTDVYLLKKQLIINYLHPLLCCDNQKKKNISFRQWN